jgi:hypothetical protein
MAKLDFPAFEKHLAAFDFVRLFIDVLGCKRQTAQTHHQLGAIFLSKPAR